MAEGSQRSSFFSLNSRITRKRAFEVPWELPFSPDLARVWAFPGNLPLIFFGWNAWFYQGFWVFQGRLITCHQKPLVWAVPLGEFGGLYKQEQWLGLQSYCAHWKNSLSCVIFLVRLAFSSSSFNRSQRQSRTCFQIFGYVFPTWFCFVASRREMPIFLSLTVFFAYSKCNNWNRTGCPKFLLPIQF